MSASEPETSRAPRHLVLIGLMGAGKTTVGARCARHLGRRFVDTDELVVARSGRPIAEIFAEEGEPAFRDLERAAVRTACDDPEPLVIACGGGAALDPENRTTMRATGLVVWLRGTPAELAGRVGDGNGRPLLADGPASDTLGQLASSRAAVYAAAAHVVVDTDDLDVDAVTARVLEELARCAA